MNFAKLTELVFKLHEEEKYVEALELLGRESANFPDKSYSTYYWRMCLSSVLHNRTETLRLFREAVESGLWFPAAILRQDADFADLQGDLEFEQLIEICDQRTKKAQEDAIPKRIALIRDSVEPLPLLLSLHGNNGNAKDSVDYWKSAFTHGWNLVLPQSSQVVGPDLYVWNDIELSVKEVVNHYSEVCDEVKVDSYKTIIGGFSRGAGTALWIALGGLIRTRGFIAVAPSFPDYDQLKKRFLESKPSGIRGYFVVGKNDARALELSMQLSELMKQNGLECQVETHDHLGHAFPSDFEHSLIKAIQYIHDGID